ncbi:DNA polymerase III subunit psi [Thalassotalea sp. 1_MG-2023]|uniref:DNA polymerase III subunit psi n=1 Tax=Thalassotalea sp. 1_MG-2023 TaxID=3062680 RepID=UPI0026E384BF|nr:DNA polymerase III subunit psi [Thalassotalea sp. 1_MG-2023]MDO6428496.1 DNA polymerase III subunit psi [Thalassotalea sp. 1_MG-2023]
MAINEKQFVYLQEMGIELWQRKSIATQNANVEKSSQTDISVHSVEINQLLTERFFLDTIQAIAFKPSSFTQVSPNKLQCDDFIWQFVNEAAIDFENNVLTTPPITDFIRQPTLKKRLFQQLLPMIISKNVD